MGNKTMVLKLLIDPKANRVLFAEAGKQVVDFLFGLLALPLGSIVKVLGKDQMVGSIGLIYSSLETLDLSYIRPDQDKDIFLNPQGPEQGQYQNNLLLSTPAPAKVEEYYGCETHGSPCSEYVTKSLGVQCPKCCYEMEKIMQYVHPQPSEDSGNGEGEEGLVNGVVTYIIMDDLSVTPMSTISCITLLNKFSVKNVDVLEEKNVSLGMQEALELLKTSFESQTVLTEVFLANKE
ncbi:uncharacterized protein LOC120273313 [Dioscorea cayenensis subsp. rotundata]|uniref:Uncharacterized protein LOC120273313 n=1 Tax=Dioscorea cayennensis subsp. rotundata TaxID=55577 RepID=A0AB40CBS1_DIOCR|nr:uncharacterized protein LOC120273313 [Dioscorea cayenensis subsp. rotundata]